MTHATTLGLLDDGRTQAACICGWVGPAREYPEAAAYDAREHMIDAPVLDFLRQP